MRFTKLPAIPSQMMLFGFMVLMANIVASQAALAQTPAPPTNVQAADAPLDRGDTALVTWTPSPDEANTVSEYRVYWTYTADSLAAVVQDLADEVTRLEQKVQRHPDRETLKKLLRTARAEHATVSKNLPNEAGTVAVTTGITQYSHNIDRLKVGRSYIFQVRAANAEGVESVPAVAAAVTTHVQYFDGNRVNLVVIVFIICGSIIAFILIARSGVSLYIRTIAGLEAVDEAVGRATEMGRPILFVPGIQDMNDMMTLAGLTALGHVAKKAAEYDAKLEVPTSKSLVMTAARETVHNAFLAAGRPDAYNQDLIYYVTDEQFGYVAYLSGHMARAKPAACFYLGAFFAESLILAETGNSVGAIQIAGTAETAQLPFFVAACDYTLIGEEFYAASAYLSGEPDQLGSLRGQDIGKAIVACGLIIGCLIATLAVIVGPESMFNTWLDFLKTSMLR